MGIHTYLSLGAILRPLGKVANKAITRYGSQPDEEVIFDQVRFVSGSPEPY